MALTLRQARRLAEKSQKELANMLGMHVQTYRKIELNPENATVRQALDISGVLGISCDDIFFSRKSS